MASRTVSVGWLNRIAAALGVTAGDLVRLPETVELPVAALLGPTGAVAPTPPHPDYPPVQQGFVPPPAASQPGGTTTYPDFQGAPPPEVTNFQPMSSAIPPGAKPAGPGGLPPKNPPPAQYRFEPLPAYDFLEDGVVSCQCCSLMTLTIKQDPIL